MTSNHHDSGYKELFSHPEFVQQLIEGFVPSEIAEIMNFNSLKLHSGNYITPLFEEKFEDLVWSVEVQWENSRFDAYLYLLLEFQSTVDINMPIRLMHYVACFYDNLLKSKVKSARKGLPPVFPIVIYNGNARWTAKQDIYDMLSPEPPEFLRPYQPHLRYYMVDEGSMSDHELLKNNTPLSGIFGIEKAHNREELQRAVNRIVDIIEQDPNKPRTDRIITRWLKRHLFRLGSEVDLDRIHSLTENQGMLAENIENWVQQERSEAIKQSKHHVASNLIRKTAMDDQIISEIADLPVEKIAQLRAQITKP